MEQATYKSAGVDLEVYRESMSRLPRLMKRTHSPRVMPLEGGFAGLFRLDFAGKLFQRQYTDPVLVSCTDGVGTKLKVAQRLGKHDTVGIDLVAMCVNDALCCGAEPLFFLDYVAMGKDDPALLEAIVTGISDGCVAGDLALVGGETAIMPDLYKVGDYDLAGFCVGVVDRPKLIDGSGIAPGDVAIGVASSGLHSNGYSLVRKVVFDIAKLGIDDFVPECDTKVGELLLTPTTIYTKAARGLLAAFGDDRPVHGIAHITGGGLQENVDRILPAGVAVKFDPGSWPVPPVFGWLQRLGSIAEGEMAEVFNRGIGLVLLVRPEAVATAQANLASAGYQNWIIGQATTS
jgi:phosphoribosylformylglycinamidine cyclo-ligase